MPALLVALPPVLTAFAWIPALRGVGSALLTLLAVSGAMVWLAQLARDRGSALQPSLYAMWGGQPSTALLRYRDATLSTELKTRYRAFLQQAVPGLSLPTAEEEDRDPSHADEMYGAAGAWLVAKTRDKKRYGLLFEENINYGFRRNFWGMKPLALLTSGAALFIGLLAIAISWVRNETLPSPEEVAATLLVAMYVVFVVVRVRPSWVRVPAVAYARELLASCDTLSPQKSPNTRPGKQSGKKAKKL